MTATQTEGVTQADIDWLESFGRSTNCTIEENDIIQRVVAIARHRAAEVERLREALEEARDQLWHLSKDPDNEPLLKQINAALAGES